MEGASLLDRYLDIRRATEASLRDALGEYNGKFMVFSGIRLAQES
jgi:hypothetical protein